MKIRLYINILSIILLVLTSTSGTLWAQESTFPYVCDFEHGFDGWEPVNPDAQQAKWIIGRGDAARRTDNTGFVTGPNKAYDNNAYAYVNLYDNYTSSSHPIAMTKVFDFSSLTNPVLSVYVHNYWTDGDGAYFRVYARDVKNQFWDINALNTLMVVGEDKWHKFNVCLPAIKGQVEVKLEIFSGGGSPSPNIAIDHLTIEDFVIDVKTQDASCYGYTDGAITLTPSCAGPKYKYSIDDGVNYVDSDEPSFTFKDLPAGPYNARIKDATYENGCEAWFPTINLAQPTEIQVNVFPTEIKCYGDANGKIVVGATQVGGDDYGYEFSVTKNNSDAFQSNTTFDNLDGGTYYIKVKNSAGCLSETKVQELGKDVYLAIDEVNVKHVTSCNGKAEGEISIKANFGKNTPIYYTINGDDNFSDRITTYPNLPAGEYHVTVMDRNMCKIKWKDPVKITEPPLLEIDKLTVTDIDGCNGQTNGSIDIKLKGGTGKYFTAIDKVSPLIEKPTYTDLAAGTYYVRASDENSCPLIVDDYDFVEVNIKEPEVLVINDVKASDVNTCNGDATGSIEILAQGGTGALTYKLVLDDPSQKDSPIPPSPNPVFSALKAGRYVPVVTDTKNCQATYEYVYVDILEPDIFDFVKGGVSSFDKEIVCNGDKTGQIFAAAYGGTLPYTFTIDNYETSIKKETAETCTFVKLGAGDYTVKAKDANGCVANDTVVTLKEPDKLVITKVTVTPVKCFSDYTGMIEIEVEGGTPDTSSILPYIFQWSIHGDKNFRPSTSSAITKLPADIYDVAVSDKYNCLAYSYNHEVTQPEKLEITAITPHDVTICYGDHNGALIINAIGGTKPYQYSIDAGTTFQSEPHFPDLYAGNDYYVIVRDSSGCEVDGGSTLINQPEPLSILNINYKDVRGCHGAKAGEITFVGSGGTGAIKYSITGFPQQANGDFLNIPGGDYALRVEDEHGCYAEHPGVTIYDPPEFELVGEPQLTHNPCHGDNKGEAILTVTGGAPVQAEFPYKFYLDPVSEDALDYGIDPTCYDGVFTYLYAKKYDVIIRDKYNCQLKTSFTITEPEKFEFQTLDTSSVKTCHDDYTGYIRANVSGGVRPVTFYCSNGMGYREQNTSGTFNNLRSTQYELIAEDNNGCQLVEYIFLEQPPQVNLTNTSYIDILCHDKGTGEIRAEGDGGIGAITFSIDGGKTFPYESGSSAIGLKSGDYTIFARDEHKCVSKNSKTIRINNPPKIEIGLEVEDVQCFTGNTGKIIAEVMGGVKPYSYSLDKAHWIDNRPFFEDLTDSTYIVYVKDINGCIEQSDSVTLKRPENQAGFTLSTYEGCTPLEFTMTQDKPGIASYIISNGDKIELTRGDVTHTIVNDDEYEHKYKITSTHMYENGVGCSDTASQYITVFPKPKMELHLVDSISVWPNNTAVFANLSSNIESSHWDFGDGTTSDVTNETTHSYKSCGYYNIILIQSDGRCVDTIEKGFYIEGRDIAPGFVTSDNNGCEPLHVTFENASQNADSLVWDFGDGTPKITGSQRIRHTYSAPGTYTATLSLYGDCGSTSSTTKTITVFPKPTAAFTQNLDTIYEGQRLRVDCQSSLTDHYIWDFGDGTRVQGMATEEHEYKYNGTYDVSLVVVSGNSCTDTAKVKGAVVVATSPVVIFPTAFTPNGDGLNDIFVPIHGYLSSYEIVILNRNGVVVYRSTNIDEGWDGTRNGKPCLPGMYVYKVKTTLRDKTIHFQYGHVMMYR